MGTSFRDAPDLDHPGPLAAEPYRSAPTRAEQYLGVVAAALFLILLTMVFIAAAPLGDPDVWWHLEMGHAYLDGASVRHPGPMSPFGTEDWHSRDWLTQMLMAGFDSAFGLPGVAWLRGLALVALFVVCFRLSRQVAPFGAAVVATGLTFFGMIGSLSARPQLVSFILLAVTVGALLRTSQDLRPRWWLAVLTGVWACAHGLWFLVPGLQVVLLVGLRLDRRLDRRSARPHVLLVGLCLAAVAVTPNGIHQLAHPLGSSMGVAQYVQEYQPLSVTFPPYAAVLLMLFVVCASWARRGGSSWVAVLLVAVGAVLFLYMGRTLPLGAILVMPFFAAAIGAAAPRARTHLPRPVEQAVVLGGAGVALVALALLVPTSAAAPSSYFPSTYDARLSAIAEGDVLINQLGDGGYLAWKYPDLRIVGDGLSDQYSVAWLTDWHEALRGEPGWEDFVERTGADYALLSDTTALRLGLESQGWTTVQTGQDRVLMKAPEG
ncbi:hypothetical protein [Nocardioides alpinus]|uniref:hypothetical protein n=1 Tax=Nocardioides alpinus TaxID=748909 RepID=UPI0011135B67|nr:hypothetical protein [Nocardioides alpinus]